MEHKTGNYHSGTGSAFVPMSSNAVAPVRQSEIDAATQEMRQEVDSLHELLGNLEQRLSPITRNVPSGAEKRGEALDTNVPLANALRGFSRDIAIARDRVGTLLDTLAL